MKNSVTETIQNFYFKDYKDQSDPIETVLAILYCAESSEDDARIIGNIRSIDIQNAITYLLNLAEIYEQQKNSKTVTVLIET
jgi:hypothetical protein